MYGLSSHQGERGTLGPHPAGELDEGNREAVEKKAAVLNLLLDIEEAVPHGDGVEDVAGSGPYHSLGRQDERDDGGVGAGVVGSLPSFFLGDRGEDSSGEGHLSELTGHCYLWVDLALIGFGPAERRVLGCFGLG